jgi:small subunit ribosomal protein S6
MRPYEVMFILDAGLEEDAVQASVDRATELVSAKGGTPGKVERWGKRRFAYELDHRWEGIYVLLSATAEPAAMAELDRHLRLADEVVRHKVIRLPDQIAGAKPAANDTGAAEAAPDNAVAAEATVANGA